MPVIKGSQQPDLRREQHAIAENVAGHIADPDDGERLRLRIQTDFPEVPLDRLPCTSGGDRHFLVVVTDRAA
ncbi:MAG: hypothetical protein CAPSK01_004247 [Candidatus Accumulibacter vicinus]|uniref:Uncharacterized protein n=1 Tax=Candidatus Accumulibacter vicinus TaxID=2954382 RepID=A0A084XV64_9PROT|nr:MAG: hypothetical protein CAPSK01_004247 [Candidatus Accumulibacter vicinus]